MYGYLPSFFGCNYCSKNYCLFFYTLSLSLSLRQEQNRRQLTNRANLSHGTAPPVYSLLDTASDITTEAETSMSEPEYSEAEPSSPPPPYNP